MEISSSDHSGNSPETSPVQNIITTATTEPATSETSQVGGKVSHTHILAHHTHTHYTHMHTLTWTYSQGDALFRRFSFISYVENKTCTCVLLYCVLS